MKADFPYARTLVIIESWRGSKEELGEPEFRYYLSSMGIKEKKVEEKASPTDILEDVNGMKKQDGADPWSLGRGGKPKPLAQRCLSV